MIINPQTALDEKWITFPIEPLHKDQLQPNGIDLRIRFAVKLDVKSTLTLFHSGKDPVTQLSPKTTFEGGGETVIFERLVPYRVETFEFVKIPKDIIAVIYGRSTLNRNGIIARSALYDSGFENYVGFAVYPFVNFAAEIGVRMAQIVFYSADTCFLYDGQYGMKNEDNKMW